MALDLVNKEHAVSLLPFQFHIYNLHIVFGLLAVSDSYQTEEKEEDYPWQPYLGTGKFFVLNGNAGVEKVWRASTWIGKIDGSCLL